MTFEEIETIVRRVSYKPGWYIRLGRDRASPSWAEHRPFIQIEVTAESDASLSPITREREPWKSGKHYLSPHMCRQEIVGAVFGAIMAAEQHEIREWFRYRGASIYNPHLDPDALVLFARNRDNFDFRENAMSMKEDSDE